MTEWSYSAVRPQDSQRRMTVTLQPCLRCHTDLDESCSLLTTTETFTMLLGCSHQKAQSHSPLSFKLAKSNKAPEIFDVIFSLNSCQPRTGTVRAPSPSLRCWQILPPTSVHFPSLRAWQRLPSPPTYCTWGCLQLAQPQ